MLAAVAAMVPARGSFPDFLTPQVEDPDVAAHVDAVASVTRRSLRDDLERTYRTWSEPPRWAREVHRSGRTRGVAEVLRRGYALMVEPVLGAACLQNEAARARYASALLDGGTDRLLGQLHPSIRWCDPVLEADYPVERTLPLRGRGLVIVPAHFCWGAPVTYLDADRTPTLVVPASSGGTTPREVPRKHLGPLLGRTRAGILTALSASASTTELAARLGVTPAAISQHVKVLREADLITTTRLGTSVRHARTPLCRQLLRETG